MSDVLIAGRPASFEDAIARTAEVLRSAHRPLVYGCVDSTVESQRLAVQIVQRLGGVIDSPAFAAAPIFPNLGTVTCSLAEIKKRADFILLWNSDPSTPHVQTFVDPHPNGRHMRHVVAIDDDFAALWLLRGLIQNKPVENKPVGGSSIADWRGLADQLRASRFGVLVADESIGARAIEAAFGLATDLQAVTRFYVLVLREAGNPIGLQNVVSWLTGRPGPVSFHRAQVCWGDEFCANRVLRRGEVDAALLIGGNPVNGLDPTSLHSLRRMPHVVLSPQLTDPTQAAAVQFLTANYAETAAGTEFRTDGIAIPRTSTSLSSAPDEFTVLSQIAMQLPPA
jgi:formylmethanofuran dehydrogenase subunit B